MKIETLNEFIVLTECKNYSQASDYLFISQSTLTKHIQQLEQELGVNLINRSKNSFSLTLDGIVFYEYAQKIVKLKQDAVSRLSAPSALKVNLSIGTGYLSASEHVVLSKAFDAFSAKYPHCSIRTARFNTFGHCKALLRGGDISVAVLKYSSDTVLSSLTDEQSFDYEPIPLYRFPLVAVLPEDHRLVGRKISVADLSAEPFILGAQNTFRHYDCVATCLGAGFEPHIAHTLDTPESAVSFVAQGKGVSIMPEPLVRNVANARVYTTCFDPPLWEQTAILSVYPRSSDTIEGRFIDSILDVLKEEQIPEVAYAAEQQTQNS